MLNRRNWVVALVALLLMASLAGCSMGQAEVPSRAVPISLDAALEGQTVGLQGLMSGQVTWTESQFSSFLTELLKQNSGPNMPIENITAWFGAGNEVTLRVTFADGVFLGGNTVDLSGKVMVSNGQLQVDLDQAAANGMVISGPILDMVSAYINSTLASPSFGIAADVSTDDGSITIKLGM